MVNKGGVSGYSRALGGNTIKFFKANESLALYEFGIFIEDRPTDEQRAMLMQQVQAGQVNNMLDIEDAIIIQNTDNLKVAQQLLAYKIKKRREQMQQEAMQQQQMNAQVQQQSSEAAEQAKQQTLQVEAQVKSQLIQVEKELDLKLLETKYQYELKLEEMRQTGKINSKHLENSGKKSVQKIKMDKPDDEQDQVPINAAAPPPMNDSISAPEYQEEPTEPMEGETPQYEAAEEMSPEQTEELPQ